MKLKSNLDPALEQLFDPKSTDIPMNDDWFKRAEEQCNQTAEFTSKWVGPLEMQAQHRFIRKIKTRGSRNGRGGIVPLIPDEDKGQPTSEKVQIIHQRILADERRFPI